MADCADALAYSARLARRLDRPGDQPTHLLREPVGVTTLIVPWDWPLLLLLRDLAPALAAGGTALVKPAPQTTLVTAQAMALGHAAGLPADVVHLLAGAAGVGRAATAQAAVRAVAFTGSARGAQILRTAGTDVRRPLFDLGGKGTMIVCADADLDGAVAASGRRWVTVTAGQMCMTCRRVLVDRRHYRECWSG